MISETSKMREYLLPYCNGNGCDLAHGGEKIKPEAIAIERPHALMHCGNEPANLIGDASNLYWFKDNVLDYVYSSHLLEDFADTKKILYEWLRVIKPGGFLVLNLPHDRMFLEHCKQTGQAYNFEHKCPQMSIGWMGQVIAEINEEQGFEYVKQEMYTGIKHKYCFGLVLKKGVRE